METTFTTDKAYMLGHVQPKGSQFELNDEDVFEFPYAGMLIAETCLNDMADLGKGYGKELYGQALNQFGVLYSTFPVSEEAFRVHESLLRAGVARREWFDCGIMGLVKN